MAAGVIVVAVATVMTVGDATNVQDVMAKDVLLINHDLIIKSVVAVNTKNASKNVTALKKSQ